MPAVVQEIGDGGARTIKVSRALDAAVLARHGTVPLPPYIKDFTGDRERYQTVYAREAGSVAAPTAGLHFTKNMLDTVAAATMGVVSGDPAGRQGYIRSGEDQRPDTAHPVGRARGSPRRPPRRLSTAAGMSAAAF